MSQQRSQGRLSSEVYATLKNQLLEGEHQPGARISVEALKTEFGVSKQPIMDALRQLATEDFVEIKPQIGCVVREYSDADRADFFELFSVLEGAVAGRAALNATVEQIHHLEAIEMEINAIVADPDLSLRAHEYRRLNRSFHELVYQMSGSDIMANITRRLWDLSDFLVNTSGSQLPFGAATAQRHKEHMSVLGAVKKRDAEAATALMSTHIRTTATLAQ